MNTMRFHEDTIEANDFVSMALNLANFLSHDGPPSSHISSCQTFHETGQEI